MSESPSSPPVEWFALRGIIDRERKLDGYLLSPTHNRGCHKARLWRSVFGIGEGDGELLERLIREQLVEAGVSPEEREPVATREDPPRMVPRWEIVIPRFSGPNGSSGPVLTAWALEPGADHPHLTNAYPLV